MKRAEILAAVGNGITLLVVAALVTFESIERLVHPIAVHGATLIVVAGVGVAVNVVATMTLAKANRRSLNIEGAYRHVVTDLYGFIGTVAAGIVIVTSGFSRADSIASLVVVALMLKAALLLLRPRSASFWRPPRRTSTSKRCAVTFLNSAKWPRCTTSTPGP